MANECALIGNDSNGFEVKTSHRMMGKAAEDAATMGECCTNGFNIEPMSCHLYQEPGCSQQVAVVAMGTAAATVRKPSVQGQDMCVKCIVGHK